MATRSTPKTPTAKKAPVSKKTAAKKAPAAKKTAAKKTPAAKKAAAKKAPAAKKTPIAKKAPAAKVRTAVAKRADLGAPIDGFFARQPAALRPIAEELRRLIEATVPEASASLKWGMPTFTIGGKIVCAIGGHKAHVNLILSGAPNTFADPEGRLTGEGKSGRHLKLVAGDSVPAAAVRKWLATAARNARG